MLYISQSCLAPQSLLTCQRHDRIEPRRPKRRHEPEQRSHHDGSRLRSSRRSPSYRNSVAAATPINQPSSRLNTPAAAERIIASGTGQGYPWSSPRSQCGCMYDACAPRPMASMATTEATPITIPLNVSAVRTGLTARAAKAERAASSSHADSGGANLPASAPPCRALSKCANTQTFRGPGLVLPLRQELSDKILAHGSVRILLLFQIVAYCGVFAARRH